MNKKGLSDVITNVLIIVLVIASIVILWSFLRPTIQKGAESTETAQCFQIDLLPVGCTNIAGNLADVSYKWNSGSADVSNVKLVLVKEDGSSTSIDGDVPDQLATIVVAGVDFGGVPKEFGVAPVIRTSSGSEITCPQTQAVQCA